MNIVFEHPIITLILVFISYQAIKCLSESRKRRKKYLDKILHLMNVSSINFLKIAKKQAILNPYGITAIEKFLDFVFLSDFKSQYVDLLNENIDNKTIYLIGNLLKEQLIAYKYRLSLNIQWGLIDEIKKEYMLSYAKMASIDIDTKDFTVFFNPLDAYTLPNNWNDLRSHIIERDKHICVLCGDKLDDKNVHIHHIIYRAHDGSHQPKNLVSLCKYCHASLPKHSKIAETLREKSPPYKESHNQKIILHIYKYNPDVISKVILSGNPLLGILDKKYFHIDEATLLRHLNPNEHYNTGSDFLME